MMKSVFSSYNVTLTHPPPPPPFITVGRGVLQSDCLSPLRPLLFNMSFNTFILQDPTEKHFGDVGILDKYEDNNNNKKNTFIQHIKSEKYRQLGFWKLSEIGIPCNPIHWFQFADDAAVISSQEKENQMLLNRATTKKRYSDTTIQRYRNRNLEQCKIYAN